MILQFFQIFLLLWLPINALTQSPSLTNPDCISISFRLPFSIKANWSCCVDKWFATSYISLAGKSLFIEKIDLDVLEFSLGGAKRGYGVKYCQTVGIPSPFKIFNQSLGSKNNRGGRIQECKYALFVDQNWFDYITKINPRFDVQEMRQVCQLLNWRFLNFWFELFAIDANSSSRNFPVLEWNCNERNTKLHLEENVDESKDIPKALFREPMIHKNLTDHMFYKHWFFSVIGSSLGGLFLLIWRSWLCIIINKTKKIKLRKLVKRNGGLFLQQMLNSYDGSVDRCKLFNAKELDEATGHFNVDRILGQGGQGTVYKGMLEDGRIIAVKKSKVVDEEKLEEFINELVVLSQINHRNVVKLLGCCLETEVPLLVYEFIPNGTLFQYLHSRNDELPLTWKMRLRIATEVAGAVSYLHSAATIPIYHRDIKSTNILLDDKYRAKVGDFGTSKFIAIDQTHVSTVVLGTLGYLDPEYYQSGQLTDKSDVYSFGVVLVELLTGEKPISSTTSQENINLAKYFVHAMKGNRLYDILDDQVKQMGTKAEITAFANLAKRCLNIKGKERPTMKEAATELEGIRALEKKKAMVSKFMKIFSK